MPDVKPQYKQNLENKLKKLRKQEVTLLRVMNLQ